MLVIKIGLVSIPVMPVNFVNNRRMRASDFNVAALCFKDVIARYPDHAFAYYFLAKAVYRINKNKRESMLLIRKVKDIITNDKNDMWIEYFDHFDIDYTQA